MAFAKLPRLPLNIRLIDEKGQATPLFQRWWATVCERLEAQEAQQDITIGELEDAVAAITAAQAAADAANAAAAAANTAAASADTAAAAAQDTADATTALSNLTNSTTTGANPTATDAGASATITIAGHTRTYGDGTAVAVTGGTVTGLAYSTQYWVYYDQASRAGGAVTYFATTAQTTAFPSAANPDRHYVGSVVTPAAAGAPVTGTGATPPQFEEPPGGTWL